MRTRSQSRSLVDSSRGSKSGDGAAPAPAPTECEPPLLLQRIEPSGSCAGSKKRARRRPADLSGSDGLTEWRDWTSLEAGIVEDIAGRLLSLDVSEYLRFRAACKSWRSCTVNPCGLDSRFRPRNWIAMSLCASPSRRTLLNVVTGARVDVDFPPELLSTHHHHHIGGSADGLLVLCDKTSKVIRLLNPLTRALIDFPAISDVRALTVRAGAYLISFRANYKLELGSTKVHVPDPPFIKGAGIDDSTNPPTLVLCLRRQLSHVVCAKPGDAHWVSVHNGEQRELVDSVTALGRILFQSILSFRGRCYLTTPRGDIMALDLGPMTSPLSPKPRMVYLHREMPLGHRVMAMSYLVRSHNDDRLLMLRYSFSRHGDLGDGPVKTFVICGALSRMEVWEMDIDGRRLIRLHGIGDKAAVFVGDAHSIMLSTGKLFPSIAANTVYLNYLWQRLHGFGAYRFEDGTTTPPRDLRPDKSGREVVGFSPCPCHMELDDYLICYVQQPEQFHNILSLDC